MEEVLSVLGVALPSLCTVLVALITVRGERNKKVEEERKKAEQEKQAERDKEINDKLQALGDKIDTMGGQIDSLKDEVEKLQKADIDTLEDLRKLSEQQHVNGEYIHQLSRLVTVIAEGMRDQHLDGNVTNAVAAFRKFERDTLSDLLNKPVVDD